MGLESLSIFRTPRMRPAFTPKLPIIPDTLILKESIPRMGKAPLASRPTSMVSPRNPPATCTRGNPSMPLTCASITIRKSPGLVRKLSPCQYNAMAMLSSGNHEGKPNPADPPAPRLKVMAKLSPV